jgi:hypothetical protein
MRIRGEPATSDEAPRSLHESGEALRYEEVAVCHRLRGRRHHLHHLDRHLDIDHTVRFQVPHEFAQRAQGLRKMLDHVAANDAVIYGFIREAVDGPADVTHPWNGCIAIIDEVARRARFHELHQQASVAAPEIEDAALANAPTEPRRDDVVQAVRSPPCALRRLVEWGRGVAILCEGPILGFDV